MSDSPGRPTTGRRRAASWLLALVAVVALRWPTHAVAILNVDEADFAVEAGALLDGGRPYVDFVEKKPPVVFLLYGGAMALVGRHNLPGIRVLLMGYVFATALVLAAIARRLYGERAALIAGPAYALAVSAGLPMDFHAVNAETLFLLPLVAGTRLSLSARAGDAPPGVRRLIAAGVCLGLASLVKQQAGMQLPILAASLLVDPDATDGRPRLADRLRAVAALAAGFLGIWLVALGVLAAVGALREFVYWTIAVNRYYIANGNSLQDGIWRARRAVGMMTSFAPVLWLMGGLGLITQVARRAAPRRSMVPLWFVGSLVPVVLGGRFFPHYFLQVYPPLVLSAAVLLAALWDRLPERRVIRAGGAFALAALVVIPAARQMSRYQDPEMLSFPHAPAKARALAAYVRESTAPDARIVVWGYGSAIYYLAERQPATRFPYVTYQVGAVEGTPAWWNPFRPSRPLEIPRAWDLFFEDFDRHPPELFIDTARPGYFAFSKFPPAKYPRLMERLDRDYTLTVVQGFPVWRRKAPHFQELAGQR